MEVNFVLAPTANHGRKPFRLLKDIAHRHGIGKANSGEHLIDWQWGAQTQFRTVGNDPGTAVGETMRDELDIDEAGLMPDDTWGYAMPMLGVHDASSVAMGTVRHRGVFYDQCMEGLDADGRSPFLTGKPARNPRFVTFRAPSSIAPWWTPELLAEMQRITVPSIFRQEYMAIPPDVASGPFGSFWEVCTASPEAPHPDGSYLIGVDPARKSDFMAVRVFRIDVAGVLAREVAEWRGQAPDWQQMYVRIAQMAQEYNHARVIVDGTGVGDAVVEGIAQLGVNVESVVITESRRFELITNLIAKIHTRQVELLAKHHDPSGYHEMAEFQAEPVMPRGSRVAHQDVKIRYGHKSDEHDDTVFARALAVNGLGRVSSFIPVA